MNRTATKNRYIAIIELNELNQRESAIAQLEKLGMKPTTSQKEWVLVFLFEGESSQFEWIRSVLNSGRFDKYFSVLETSRAPEYIEPLPSTSPVTVADSWRPLQWLERGVSELAKVFGNWEVIYFSGHGERDEDDPTPSSEAIAMCGSEETIVSPSGFKKSLTISGETYELRVSCQDRDRAIWDFELRRSDSSAKIPPGVKLRLIDQDWNSFEGNEDQAEEPVDHLLVRVQLEEGEGLIWQIEPEPEDYQPEVLWF